MTGKMTKFWPGSVKGLKIKNIHKSSYMLDSRLCLAYIIVIEIPFFSTRSFIYSYIRWKNNLPFIFSIKVDIA